jgi:CheY-like chemotaxis protein
MKELKHLIYDPSPMNRVILRGYIESFGCKVSEVDTPQNLIDKVKKHNDFTVIWIDLQMPDMSGIECVNNLRNTVNYLGPIIAITGYLDNLTRDVCYQAEITHIITKPYNMESIKAYVEKYS